MIISRGLIADVPLEAGFRIGMTVRHRFQKQYFAGMNISQSITDDLKPATIYDIDDVNKRAIVRVQLELTSLRTTKKALTL